MDKLLSGRRVLVVEDEILVLMMIEDMLSDLGCQSVISAATIGQAITLIKAQIFDAAMLDMNLDGDDSNTVADALAERGVPFIYSTGNSDRDMRKGFSDRAVLRKPFSFDELTSKLERLLSG
ncbi:response regulator (plasmid) [Mesorhizobium sp. AR07]|uniref:response regulator n=1 Tax=Mesorhizobium sp. AR07 TaxID=2865838 RepID=UPI00215DF670|nr:response regulator [Mesorhizobium sp. AR07]UVK49431.1 response regulator [Mesorhizobium sp. AR07]